MNIIAVIPARSGSKKIINKNIRKINGIPLFAYSILQARQSNLINRVIVNTDSIQYKNIALKYRAEVPFMRPKSIAGDFSTDFELFDHLLKWLSKNENYTPNICVHLRPTYPYRKVEDIDRMIELLIDKKVDSIRSVSRSSENPYKMWTMKDNQLLSPVVKEVSGITDPYNSPRQALPVTYIQNASIDVFWRNTIIEKRSMTGDTIMGYEMKHNYDIDDVYELKVLRKLMKNEKDILL